MTDTAEPTYHQRVAGQKRALIVTAAARLFLEHGYDRTSLARIADEAQVSKATLFKQFPTKAALFAAIVTESWASVGPELPPSPSDVRAGLTTLGTQYAALLTRPTMAPLFRIVIAELGRFPELGQMLFDLGKMPYFESVQAYLQAQQDAGTMAIDDARLAATQLLGMIADYVFWPRMLLTGYDPGAEATARAVTEAVDTLLARYRAAG